MIPRNPVESAKKAKEYQCLKIVESLMRGDNKTADKSIERLIKKRLGDKINFVIKSDNLF